MSNSTLRVLTAIVGAPVVVGLTYVGGWPFAVLLVGIALVAQHEMYGMLEAAGLRPMKTVGLVAGGFVAVRALWPMALPIALAIVLVLLAASPFVGREKRSPDSLAAVVFGIVYPTLCLTFLIDLRLARGVGIGDAEAFWLALSVILLIWATDTFAYFVGRAIGRHPLAPEVSPKKTWEGTVGGAVAALIVAVILKLTVLGFLDWLHVIVVALLCGVVSQLGDLAESRMKRTVGVKDSSTILPGHGGLLDRFDAMILAVPCVYLYLAYVARLF